MANTDNACKDLSVQDKYSESTTHLADIMERQRSMQEGVYGYNFADMSMRDLMNYWHMNSHSLIDEIHEATDALGGIKDGDGNAIWKRWKKAYATYSDRKISDMSEGDRKELYMEIVDILHFFCNMAVSVGMDAQTMYNYYFAKAAENVNRQTKGY